MDFKKENIKTERLEKLTLIKKLINLTGLYSEFQFLKEVSHTPISEEEKEKIGILIKTLTGDDISPDELIEENQDKKNNNLIDAYTRFTEEFNNSVQELGIEKGKLTKIIEELYNETYIINPTIWLFYPDIITIVQLYILKSISKKEMIERFGTIDLQGNYKPISLSFFRRTLSLVFETYNKIMKENG